MNNRLQFLKHDEIFETRELALDYISDMLKSKALYGEPAVVRYGKAQEPNIILAISSVGDGNQKSGNRVFIIDTAKIQEDIAAIQTQIGNDNDDVETLKLAVERIKSSCGLDEYGNYIKDIDDDLLKKSNSLNDSIKILSYALQELDKITTLTVKDTNTINLVSSQDSENGTVLKGHVKVSTYGELDPDFNDNIIVKMNDGLFASVDLTYDDTTGVLKFSASGKKPDGSIGVKIIEKEYKIGLHTKLESIDYNSDTEEFILTFTDSDGKTTTQTVSSSGIIEEWEVYNAPNTSVMLTRERKKAKKDKLSADIVLSSGQFNILKKSQTTGGLYVKGTADNIKYDNTLTVKDMIDMLSKNDTTNLDLAKAYTDSQVAAEKERAVAKENAIKDELDAEVVRAKNAEQTLQAAINIINGDNETQGSIKKALQDAKSYTDAETKRAEEVEEALQAAINTINGNEAQEGSIKETLKLAKQYADQVVNAETERAEEVENNIIGSLNVINGNEAQEGSIKNALYQANKYTDDALAKHDDKAFETVNELKVALANEVKRSTITANETNTVKLNVEQIDAVGTTMSSDVKLSNAKDNIIIADNAGLYATVKLTYSLAENSLYFYNGLTDTPQKLQLSAGTLIHDAYYDASNKMIILEVVNANGQIDKVEIPVADLISGWNVGRKPGSAVILTKEQVSGTDYLYGDVEVSTDSDNILSKSNGVLKVSNQSTGIIYTGTTSVKEKLDSLSSEVASNKQEAKDYTDSKVKEESDRAQLAEQTEKERAMGIEQSLQDQITAEVARATKAESDETTRAINSENALNANIELNKESINLINADKDTPGSFRNGDYIVSENMKFLINQESDRAKGAEAYLQEQIDKLNGSGSGSISDILDQAKKYTDSVFAPVPGLIEAAKNEAISTAAADATNKADKAKAEAISAAADDATIKADQALEDAKEYAVQKSEEAKNEAISTAAADATEKANKALEDAKAYTDANHIYTTGATVNAENNKVTIQFRDSSLNYEIDLTPIINKAVEEAVAKALEQAATNIQFSGVTSDSCYVTVDNNATPRTIKVDVYKIDNGMFS